MTNDFYTCGGGLTEAQLINGKMESVRRMTYTDKTGENGQLDAERKYYESSDLWQLNNPRSKLQFTAPSDPCCPACFGGWHGFSSDFAGH